MKRVYVIVLDEPDEETPEWDFFEDCVKQSALESWDTTGYSSMGYIDLKDSIDEFDSSDRVWDVVSDNLSKIAHDKAEDDGEA